MKLPFCERILQKVGLKGYEIGLAKVFLREGQMAALDARSAEVLGRSPSIIQRKFCSYIARKSYTLLHRTAVFIKFHCRGVLARCVYEERRMEATLLGSKEVHGCTLLEKQIKTLLVICLNPIRNAWDGFT